MYHGQNGSIQGDTECSQSFRINAGVRQGCVLSPRLFCAVVQWAMKSWRDTVEMVGVDLGDGLPRLLDLRFADDILIFASAERTERMDHRISTSGLAIERGNDGDPHNGSAAAMSSCNCARPCYKNIAAEHGSQMVGMKAVCLWFQCKAKILSPHFGCIERMFCQQKSIRHSRYIPLKTAWNFSILFRSGIPDCAPIRFTTCECGVQAIASHRCGSFQQCRLACAMA